MSFSVGVSYPIVDLVAAMRGDSDAVATAQRAFDAACGGSASHFKRVYKWSDSAIARIGRGGEIDS